MNSQTAQVDDIRLVALPSAVNCTDIFIRFSLTEWSLPGLMDDASAAARRLVKAIVDRTDSRAPGFVTVRARVTSDCLVIEVEDDEPAAPNAAPPALDGLRTGVVPLNARGKLVWCELPLPAGVSGTEVRLPRRDARRSLVAEQADGDRSQIDPELVERVLVGLNRREW
ncbi:ATP-binding protein [Qaidamihabitans albus]|uniref:ATP-binding protein n=1 Tax=Qaidamihabitans albus TaxID=2795733 RepID=UPI0018F1C956|nr:ATP-binding protein [Qaidamihabitans albus]